MEPGLLCAGRSQADMQVRRYEKLYDIEESNRSLDALRDHVIASGFDLQ